MRLAILLYALLLASCSPSPDGEVFSVTAYNAYALFDSTDDGDEYEGFRSRDGYGREAYQERIRRLAILLGRRCSSSDVLVLSEVESEIVLHDLLEHGLRGKGFSYYGLASDGTGTLFTGFISKKQPLSVTIHSIPGCRPILEASFMAGSECVTVFGVHFRSRLDDGGGEEIREEEARYLRMLMESCPSLAIAAGDFNADPRFPESAMALYPDGYDSSCAFHVTGDPSRTAQGIYFSPFMDDGAVLAEEGTYCYGGSWYFYDNALLSGECWDGDGLEYCDAWITSSEEMKDLLGRPRPFDASDGLGYSDHFPVTVMLRSR